VLRTRVGYAGGTTDKPTYRSIGDHTEAIQVEFDPDRISYAELLKVFWANHSPFSTSWSTQYKAVLWTHGAEQARAAKASAAALAKQAGEAPKTEIVPATRFWIAEDYHQKYYLRGRKELLAALFEKKPSDEAIRESTLTARVNGWIGGHGTKAEIAAESDRLGLREAARKALAKALGKRAPALCR
jgi:peptide-methionine (S)-S-oxide reductase